jgi:hypothetical protein
MIVVYIQMAQVAAAVRLRLNRDKIHTPKAAPLKMAPNADNDIHLTECDDHDRL